MRFSLKIDSVTNKMKEIDIENESVENIEVEDTSNNADIKLDVDENVECSDTLNKQEVNTETEDHTQKTGVKNENVENVQDAPTLEKFDKFAIPELKFEITTEIGTLKHLYVGSDDTDSLDLWFDNMLVQRFIKFEETKVSEYTNSHYYGHSSRSQPVQKNLDGYNVLNISSKIFFYKKGTGFDTLIAFRDKLVKMSYQKNYKKFYCSFTSNHDTCPSCFKTDCECYVRYCPLIEFSTSSRGYGYSYSVESLDDAKIQYEEGNTRISKTLKGNPLETFVEFLTFMGEELAKKHKYNRILIT